MLALDADRGFSGNAVNTHCFGFERETEVVTQSRDLRVLDAGLRLEFEGRHDRTG
jgi:hypothetical protein